MKDKTGELLNTSGITVLSCTSTAVYAIPPLVTFGHKSINPKLIHGELPISTSLSKKGVGWIYKYVKFTSMDHLIIYALSLAFNIVC